MDTINWKKWGILALALMVAIAITVACGTADQEVSQGTPTEENEAGERVDGETEEDNDTEGSGMEQTGGEENQDASAESGDAFPVTVTDDMDREVTITEEPEAIVSLIPSNTEIAFALGAGDRVVGVSEHDNYPEEVNDIEPVAGMEINIEKILSLEADLALLDSSHNDYDDVVDTLEQAGIAVVITENPSSFEGAYESMRLIGEVTGTSENAEEIISDMQERLEEIQGKAEEVLEEKKVWIEVEAPPSLYTTGSGTFVHEMLEYIHATNVAAEEIGWAQMTEEEVVQFQPDVIVTTYGSYVEHAVEGVLTREGWSEVPAIQNEQVFDVDNDLVSRPGPRLIDGVESLGQLIYPEIFN